MNAEESRTICKSTDYIIVAERLFAEKSPTGLIGQQPAAQLPWFHLVTLLTKVSTDSERAWHAAYAKAAKLHVAIAANLKELGYGD